MRTLSTRFPAGGNLLFYASVITLFLITHLTVNRIQWLTDLLMTQTPLSVIDARTDLIVMYAPLLKLIAFIATVLVIFSHIVRDLWPSLQNTQWHIGLQAFAAGVAAFLILGILVFNPGTESMGDRYANISLSPFTQKENWYNTRLLMPAFANIFQLKGERAYYVFSVFLTVLFIALLYIWNKNNQVEMPFWQIISLSTCSFIIFQFQKGGYPDILVFIFFILVMQENIGQNARLSFLILALLTHESSLFIGVLLAWRYLSRDRFIAYLVLIALYLGIWLAFAKLDLGDILSSHNVNDRSGWEWVLRRPWREVLGVFIAFKAVWIPGLLAAFLAWKNKLNQDLLFILGCMFMGMLMTFMGVDTSRMMSFAFPGFLVALALLAKHLKHIQKQRLFNTVFLLNILIPSIYIGLAAEIGVYSGLYKIIYGRLLTFFTG